MNPRQVVVEFYVALERATGHGNIEKARKAARAIGCSFTNSESSLWLKPFIDAAEKRQVQGQVQRQGIHEGIGRTNGSANGLTRAVKVSLFDEPVGSLRSPTAVAPQATVEEPVAKQPRDRRLPFDQELFAKRDEIVNAVWTLLEPSIGRAVKKTDWRDVNRKYALAMARVGMTATTARAGWERASMRLGSPCRSLKIVHDEIQQAHVERAAAHA